MDRNDTICRQHFNHLTSKEKKLYLYIREELYCLNTNIKINDGVQAEVINRLLHSILVDNPDLFWFEGKWKADIFESEVIIKPFYTLDKKQIKVAKNRIASIVSNVVNSCNHYSLSNDKTEIVIKKIEYIYDWILDNVDYGFENGQGQTIYDSLIHGKALCKGLSKTVQLISEKAGIEASLREGSLDRIAKHVWNIVIVNGHVYNLDVSLGYPCFSHLYPNLSNSKDRHHTILITDEEILKTHTITSRRI